MKPKKIISAAVAAAIFLTNTGYAADTAATRGYTAEYLVRAADFYNPGVAKSDILKGYEDGELHEERCVTRAEALVMIKRAFKEFPELTGHNKRVAIPAESFNDIPDWAKSELSDIFDAGIAAGTAANTFSPDEPLTEEQLKLFTERVYSLFGTNKNDDFYAAVNRDTLNSLEIKPGRVISGTLYELSDKATAEVGEIIKNAVSEKNVKKGSPEQKTADLYKNILDRESREKAGLEPIRPYLDELENVKNLAELDKFQCRVIKELYTPLLAGFSINIDLKDSTKYVLDFSVVSPSMTKDFYESGSEEQYNSYIKYLSSAFEISGEDKTTAAESAKKYYEFEKKLSAASLDTQEYFDADKIYNIFTFDELGERTGYLNPDNLLSSEGLKKEDKIIVADLGLADAFVKMYTNENIDTLKVVAKLNLLMTFGGTLNDRFTEISETFNQEYLGISGGYTDEERASIVLQDIMPEYIGKIYAEKYFDEKSKADVVKMISDIITAYKKRIDNLTWMSETTKKRAKSKLDTMTVKVGYPDNFESYLDNADIKSKEDGGSYFENIVSISEAAAEYTASLQGTEVDKTSWIMYPFVVNACYSPTSNDITFPAAILQAPFYDINASYEENLGGIGYIIAHEITHAFDNNGAKFDENGNAADWWTKEDYDNFTKLCESAKAFYDGCEEIPGIPINGTLTLSENIADLGAVSCITEIVSGLENPDYKKLYTQIAHCWATTETREYASYAAQSDVHSPSKIRVNRVIVNCDEFYRAFGITENDGMYIAPENRIKIW